MRQADINRVKRAKEHLKAAVTLLNNIKWENTTEHEDFLLRESKNHAENADLFLFDILIAQEKE